MPTHTMSRVLRSGRVIPFPPSPHDTGVPLAAGHESTSFSSVSSLTTSLPSNETTAAALAPPEIGESAPVSKQSRNDEVVELQDSISMAGDERAAPVQIVWSRSSPTLLDYMQTLLGVGLCSLKVDSEGSQVPRRTVSSPVSRSSSLINNNPIYFPKEFDFSDYEDAEEDTVNECLHHDKSPLVSIKQVR